MIFIYLFIYFRFQRKLQTIEEMDAQNSLTLENLEKLCVM
jgi:hypothetical protein